MRFYSLCFCLMLALFAGGCPHSRQRQAEGVILNIEAYRERTGTLPHSLADLGIPHREEGPVYYDKVSENHYKIWIGLTLGESLVYDSKSRTWH